MEKNMGLEVFDFATRDEWLEARKNYVTATEVAQLIRRSQSYWDELRDIKAGRKQAPDIGHLPAVKHGREREEHIMPELKKIDSRLEHNEKLFVLNGKYAATPDAIDSDNEVAGEIKTVKDSRLAGLLASDSWPTGIYYDQVQWQLFVTGAEACVFAWEPYEDWDGELVPREDKRSHELIRPDAKRIGELKTIADKFLDGDTPPVPDEVQVILSRLRDVRKEKAHIVQPILDREKELLDELKALAGGQAATWDSGDIRISVSAPGESRRFDKKKLFKDNPTLVEADYVTVTKKAPSVRITERE